MTGTELERWVGEGVEHGRDIARAAERLRAKKDLHTIRAGWQLQRGQTADIVMGAVHELRALPRGRASTTRAIRELLKVVAGLIR